MMQLVKEYAKRVNNTDPEAMIEPAKRAKYYSDMARLAFAVAESGDREYEAWGMFHYGKLVVTGKTLNENMSDGLAYLMKAAKLNLVYALQLLATIVQDGQCGVPTAPEKAQKLRARAAQIEELKGNRAPLGQASKY
jgi:TPR repeat protein